MTQKQYFNRILNRFATETEVGRDHKAQSNIGFIDGEHVFMKFSAKAAGGLYDPFYSKNPFREKWETQLRTFNKKAHRGVNGAK